MGKIGTGAYSQTATIGSKEGAAGNVPTKGKFAAGGSKLGSGKKLKSMMVWKDVGTRSPYK